MILSVISPVYKCKQCLQVIYERLVQTIESISDIDEFEIIFVEDCGEDGSWQLIEALAQKDSRVKGFQFSRNFGQNQAIHAGIEACKGDWAVVIDCDLQDQPEEIINLWQKAQEGYDVVNAKRQFRQDSVLRKFASRFYHILLEWLSGLSYDPDVAHFRLISRKVISAYTSMQENSNSFGSQIQWLGFPTAYIEVVHANRRAGKSSYTFKKLLSLAFDVITSFSNRPLKISIALGAIISFFSIIALILILVRYFLGSDVTGWSSIMASLWLLGGIVIINLGIVGIYLGKTYDETRKRPKYIISKTTE